MESRKIGTTYPTLISATQPEMSEVRMKIRLNYINNMYYIFLEHTIQKIPYSTQLVTEIELSTQFDRF